MRAVQPGVEAPARVEREARARARTSGTVARRRGLARARGGARDGLGCVCVSSTRLGADGDKLGTHGGTTPSSISQAADGTARASTGV